MMNLIELSSQINRPTLGEEVPLKIFRAFRIATGLYLEDLVGNRGAVTLFQNAGRKLGKEVGQKLKDEKLERYIGKVVEFVQENKLGILIPEDIDKEFMVFSLDECITCSGMPNIGKRICHFEAGFVAGIVEAFLGKKVKVYETKCNANGEGICQVKVELKYA